MPFGMQDLQLKTEAPQSTGEAMTQITLGLDNRPLQKGLATADRSHAANNRNNDQMARGLSKCPLQYQTCN